MGVRTADVCVVGGGPAGAAAAATLAGHGLDVLVVDKARFPRDKCCGDGLTTGALRILDRLGLDPRDVPSWQPVREAVVCSPSGRAVTLPLGDPAGPGVFAATARRIDLDAAVLDLARKAGADVLEDTTVTGARLAATDSCVRVDLDGGDAVVARYVVAADGMWSTLRKALLATPGGGTQDEPAGYLGDWHGFRQYFDHVGPLAASQLWVWFEADLLPGYLWSFPLPGGRANVGYGLLRGSKRAADGGPLGKHMKRLWPELLERPHVRAVLGEHAVPEAPHKAWPIPARLGETVLDACGGRVLFVGDAARATDPLTGEGIGQALETGVLAATSIAAAGALAPHLAGRRYRDELRRGMVVDHALAGFLSSVVAHRKGVRAAVRIAGATPWVRRNFGRWLFEDYPRAILATPHRWHAGMMAGSPAFSAIPDTAGQSGP